MSEMVERGARAVVAEQLRRNEAVDCEAALAYAEAVIEAIREPTWAMLRPGGDRLAYFDLHRNDDAWGIWLAMIDVALGKPPTGLTE